ncbi:MAG: OsmC family protein [Phycisphaerales bacterium]
MSDGRGHEYNAKLVWEGDEKVGTLDYSAYSRQYRVEFAGKPRMTGTADPMFKGDPKIHNPEDMFLASIAGCHMLSYLALCAKYKVNVLAYEDDVWAKLELSGGGGKFTEVVLRPKVRVAAGTDVEKAKSLHDGAHHICFIANSCSVPIRVEAEIVVGG